MVSGSLGGPASMGITSNLYEPCQQHSGALVMDPIITLLGFQLKYGIKDFCYSSH